MSRCRRTDNRSSHGGRARQRPATRELGRPHLLGRDVCPCTFRLLEPRAARESPRERRLGPAGGDRVCRRRQTASSGRLTLRSTPRLASARAVADAGVDDGSPPAAAAAVKGPCPPMASMWRRCSGSRSAKPTSSAGRTRGRRLPVPAPPPLPPPPGGRGWGCGVSDRSRGNALGPSTRCRRRQNGARHRRQGRRPSQHRADHPAERRGLWGPFEHGLAEGEVLEGLLLDGLRRLFQETFGECPFEAPAPAPLSRRRHRRRRPPGSARHRRSRGAWRAPRCRG